MAGSNGTPKGVDSRPRPSFAHNVKVIKLIKLEKIFV